MHVVFAFCSTRRRGKIVVKERQLGRDAAKSKKKLNAGTVQRLCQELWGIRITPIIALWELLRRFRIQPEVSVTILWLRSQQAP
jgi:hypothetical protein